MQEYRKHLSGQKYKIQATQSILKDNDATNELNILNGGNIKDRKKLKQTVHLFVLSVSDLFRLLIIYPHVNDGL